jgi:hypothetical protein
MQKTPSSKNLGAAKLGDPSGPWTQLFELTYGGASQKFPRSSGVLCVLGG